MIYTAMWFVARSAIFKNQSEVTQASCCKHRLIKKNLIPFHSQLALRFYHHQLHSAAGWIIIKNNVALQGDFDPKELIEKDTNNNKETVKKAAIDYLNELGPTHLISNLGEGLGGLESTELVNGFLNVIHDESSKMIASAEQTCAFLWCMCCKCFWLMFQDL